MSKDKKEEAGKFVDVRQSWTRPEDCPQHASFLSGYVPMDEPPGISEADYKRWKELGGQIAIKAQITEEKPKRRGLDPELQAMAKIDAILASLDDEEAVVRVLSWLNSRQQQMVLMHYTILKDKPSPGGAQQ
jgi:hypothetical protein